MNDQEIKTIGDFLREIPAAEDESSIQVARDLLGDDKTKFTVCLQNRTLQPEPPVRAESPRRNHVFNDHQGFMAYLEKYGSENTVIFASAENNYIYAILDDKAEKGFETITLTPIYHPLYAPWDAILGKSVTLGSFVEFLLANRRAIYKPDGRELLLMLSQIRASSNTTLARGQGVNKTANGIMCEMSIQAEVKSELVDLPESIEINCPIYYKTTTRFLDVDIIMSMQNNEIMVLVTSADVAVAKLECFDEMVEALKVIEKYVVTTGYPGEARWVYID